MNKGTFLFVLAALTFSPSLACLADSPAKSPPFTERTPAYFVDRYGSGSPSKTISKHSFVKPKRGSIEIKGPFSIRDFKRGDLMVRAVFQTPSLKLTAVRLQLPRQWTAEQIEAALNAYGSGWKEVNEGFGTKEWRSLEGLSAIYLLTFLEIQSPFIVREVEAEVARGDKQRTEIPKF